jgi:hypothetical protein
MVRLSFPIHTRVCRLIDRSCHAWKNVFHSLPLIFFTVIVDWYMISIESLACIRKKEIAKHLFIFRLHLTDKDKKIVRFVQLFLFQNLNQYKKYVDRRASSNYWCIFPLVSFYLIFFLLLMSSVLMLTDIEKEKKYVQDDGTGRTDCCLEK